MQFVLGHDQTVWQWANAFFESPLKQPDWAIGIVNDKGVLQGAVLGHESNSHTVEISICGERWITPRLVRTFFEGAFQRYWRIEVRTTKDNKAVKRNAPKWGFKFEGTAKDFFGEAHDALRFAMLRSHCRRIRKDDPSTVSSLQSTPPPTIT